MVKKVYIRPNATKIAVESSSLLASTMEDITGNTYNAVEKKPQIVEIEDE